MEEFQSPVTSPGQIPDDNSLQGRRRIGTLQIKARCQVLRQTPLCHVPIINSLRLYHPLHIFHLAFRLLSQSLSRLMMTLIAFLMHLRQKPQTLLLPQLLTDLLVPNQSPRFDLDILDPSSPPTIPKTRLTRILRTCLKQTRMLRTRDSS